MMCPSDEMVRQMYLACVGMIFVFEVGERAMPTFAAVDIGSNSCRLKIASVQMHRLKTLHEDREVTRLGESVFQTGSISPEAMAGTIRALKRFHKAVQLHVADKVRVVATSAMRDARNAEAFTEWVKSATGWNVEVISGLEEGRLIHLGVVTHEAGAQGQVSADRPGRRKLRGDGFRWWADQVDGEHAAGRGAAAAGVSADGSAGEGGRGAAEAVHRPRVEAGGEEAGTRRGWGW